VSPMAHPTFAVTATSVARETGCARFSILRSDAAACQSPKDEYNHGSGTSPLSAGAETGPMGKGAMNGKVLVLSHRKGGVGKTTTTIHLATGVASLGYPVVAVDLDPQGNLGEFLGLGQSDDMCNLLMSPRPDLLVKQTLTPVDQYPMLKIIRSNDRTLWAERSLSDPAAPRSLAQSLHDIIDAVHALTTSNGRVPFVMLDTPPGLGPMQVAALSVSDYLIIPIHAAFASAPGPVAHAFQGPHDGAPVHPAGTGGAVRCQPDLSHGAGDGEARGVPLPGTAHLGL
jgi:hypothetical protein